MSFEQLPTFYLKYKIMYNKRQLHIKIYNLCPTLKEEGNATDRVYTYGLFQRIRP